MLILKMQRKMPESCVGCSFHDEVTGVCLPTEETDDFFYTFSFDRENGYLRAWKERDPRCPLMEVPDDDARDQT